MKMDYASAHNEELEYINFFQSFLLFLTKTFDAILTHESLSLEKSNQMERNVMTSLFLLWTLHVCIFSKRILNPKASHEKLIIQTFDEDQTEKIFLLLQQLKKEVEQYAFLNKSYKIQCENTLEQILEYYHLKSFSKPIVESNLQAPPPWISKNY
ncbi:hypothetical protein [Psychrobacillus sp. NPDC093200]|uniref:hypothetical protein n=1 Tax=Psychrobacillus sp. NPDC093200 TaxID=3390656 RepID=UPI003D08A3F0